MVNFSNDADILKYEPVLFGELHLPWQVLAAGTGGTLSGTTFTASGADFVSASVTAGQVIYLQSADGSLEGAYEIVSVDSATQLSISVIRADSDDDAVAPPAATDISYRISTFGPQASEVSFQLTEYFGIRPGNPASDIDIEDVLDTDVLKRASVFAVMSSVYATWASKAEDENSWKKSLHYRRLFEKARERCRLSIDVSGNGVAEVTKSGASVKLVRDYFAKEEQMNATLDGQKLFDEQDLKIEPGSVSRDSIERTVSGLNGVLSIDLGGRSREIKQRGVLRAKSRSQMNNRISTISAYMDGNTHTLATSSDEEFDNLRMDVFKVTKKRASGSGFCCDYEIIYTQLVV